MATKKTQEEIEDQIAKLVAERAKVPEYSIFGDDNWHKIDTQLAVLRGERTSEDCWNDDDEEAAYAAEEAEEWMEGLLYDDLC